MTASVSPADIDEQNHVNNTVYLRWVQDVATAHWKALASADAQAAIGWIVLRHEIDYKSPAALGDEILLRTWVGVASRLKFERFTEIRRRIDPPKSASRTDSSFGEDGSDVADTQLLSQARTLWVPIDVRTGKPTRVSVEVREKFAV